MAHFENYLPKYQKITEMSGSDISVIFIKACYVLIQKPAISVIVL
jgi:hypothetical protein